MMRHLQSLLLVVSVFAFPVIAADNPIVAIIIDDMGHQLDQDRRAMALQGALTYSVLPKTPGVGEIVRTARKNGNELMLHLPMESLKSDRYPAPGTLTDRMNWTTFVRTFQSNLASVPGVIAVNNHQGSKLTADYQRMQWLMQELAFHRLAFVDSRTTRHTVALNTARQYGLPSTRRDIFLDHDPGKINEQFNELIQRARRNGSALAIGHPREETINYLHKNLGRLQQEGIKLVPVSQLIAARQQLKLSRGDDDGKRTGATGRGL